MSRWKAYLQDYLDPIRVQNKLGILKTTYDIQSKKMQNYDSQIAPTNCRGNNARLWQLKQHRATSHQCDIVKVVLSVSFS